MITFLLALTIVVFSGSTWICQPNLTKHCVTMDKASVLLLITSGTHYLPLDRTIVLQSFHMAWSTSRKLLGYKANIFSSTNILFLFCFSAIYCKIRPSCRWRNWRGMKGLMISEFWTFFSIRLNPGCLPVVQMERLDCTRNPYKSTEISSRFKSFFGGSIQLEKTLHCDF